MMERFIKISYTGKVKDTGAVFDTSDAKVAKEEGLEKKGRVFKSLPLVVGAGQVITGLDEALEKMKEGDEKSIEISPEKAFGKRNPDLVRLVSMRVFREQKMNPVPGMMIELDGRPAKIQTVSGGRVRVDYNPELAGRTVIFDVKVEEEAKKKEDKIMYLIERSFESSGNFKVVVLKGKKLKISIPRESYVDRNILVKKASLAAEIFKFLGFENITFEEVWSKK